MFFSVIVPVYNAEKTVKECLKSIHDQIYGDFEVLIIDDGSSDSSAQICAEFTELDSRFRYYYQENKGVSAARNEGFSLAGGKFITCIDADDRYHKDYLQRFYEAICAFPSCDHFWCGYRTLEVKNNTEERTVLTGRDKLVLSDRSEIITLYDAFLAASPCNKAYRRSVIRSHDLQMEEGLSLGEDLLFNFQYLDCCVNTQIVLLNDALYDYYCYSDESLNHKYRRDLKDIYFRLSYGMLACLEKWDLCDTQMAAFYGDVFGMLFRAMRNAYHPQSTLSAEEKIRLNNSILRSTLFREALNRADCEINPLYKLAFFTRNYRFVKLLDQLAKIRRAIVR